jgi:hypothetical protein
MKMPILDCKRVRFPHNYAPIENIAMQSFKLNDPDKCVFNPCRTRDNFIPIFKSQQEVGFLSKHVGLLYESRCVTRMEY